ncbi:MAG: hypothetical protein HUN04_06020 [Desulfobacter sp.]|nr:MAG: hypothetical protein HUN04_06020 [Desulfobacter sp.]
MVGLRSEMPEEYKRLYSEYDRFDGPELYQEMVRRNHGRIKVLALDLEYTLITSAVTQWPRPGLYEFLEAVKTMFERVVIYTAVAESLFREVANNLVREKDVPEWFADIEYIDWPRQGYKDLSLIPGIESHEALLVDDFRPYAHPEQLFQWVRIVQYSGGSELDGLELVKILMILELIQTGEVSQKSIVDHLAWLVDDDISIIKRLRLYPMEGPFDPLKIAVEVDPIAEENHYDPIKRTIPDLFYDNLKYFFKWTTVEQVPFCEGEAIEIINTWESFYAVFKRSPGRIDISFPDLPGLKAECVKKEGDNSFDNYTLQAYDDVREALAAWLQTAKPEDIPEQRFSRKKLKELYPDDLIETTHGQLPWRKREGS